MGLGTVGTDENARVGAAVEEGEAPAETSRGRYRIHWQSEGLLQRHVFRLVCCCRCVGFHKLLSRYFILVNWRPG